MGGPEAYDDAWALRNPRVRSPRALLASFVDPTPRSLDGVRLPPYAYRPLAEASFAATPSTWANLLLHALSTLLVLRIARQLGAGGAWAALLFAVHPFGVQAVSYLFQRALALQVLLGLLSITLYLDGRREGRFPRLAWVAALLSMTAKEGAAALPLSLLALERLAPGGGSGRLRRWLPFAALALLPLLQMLRVRGAELALGRDFSAEPRPDALEHILGQAPVLVRYLGLLAAPFPLRFAFDRPPTALPLLPCLAALGALGLWLANGKGPRLALALFLAPLALETLAPVHDPAWMYRGYPGLLGGGLLLEAAASRFGRPACAAVLACLCALSASESRLWRSPGDLRRRDVRTAPHRPAAWGDRAWDLLTGPRLAAPAERLAAQGERMSPGHPKAASARAYALLALGRREEGRRALREARERFPGFLPLRRMEAELDALEGR